MTRMTDHEAAGTLRSTTMFGALGEEPLLKLARACGQRTHRRGQYLWYQDDTGDRLVVICAGLVKVMLASERGDEIVLATAGAGEVLGELAVLDGSPRSASVVAVEDTTVLSLDRVVALELMSTEPAVLEAVLRSLAGLVRRLTEQTADLVFLDLGGRLAKLLLGLVHDTGETSDPVVLNMGLSQSELAAMVGGTRPAVNRALQLLASRGLISIEPRAITLRDLPGLRRRAGQ
jgi:CRP-like cAMP-binding protein